MGAVLGGGSAIGAAQVPRRLIVDVGPVDVSALVTDAGVLLAVAAIAALVPARRAGAVDPIVVPRDL